MATKRYWSSKVNSPEELYIFRKTGRVAGNQTWSETYVSGEGGGGGGYLHQGSGFVGGSNVSISSKVTERNRFFLKEEGGDETEFNDAPVSCRDGHFVSVIYVGHRPEDWGWPGYFYNHNTKAEGRNNVIKRKVGAPSLIIYSILLLSVVAFIFYLYDGFPGFIGVVMLLVAVTLIMRSYFSKSRRAKDVERCIESEIDSLMREANAEVERIVKTMS